MIAALPKMVSKTSDTIIPIFFKLFGIFAMLKGLERAITDKNKKKPLTSHR
jgi:hypothetical protein